MRVLVDAHMLGHRETGNESYVRGLLSGLTALEDVHVAAAIEPEAAVPDTLGSTIEWLPLQHGSSVRRLADGLATLARRWKADVCHATYMAPFRLPCPVVVSVHDVSFRRYPQFFSLRDRVMFAALLPGSLRRAAAILTLSSHTRDEINTFYPGHQNKIHVVPAAQEAIFRRLEPAAVDRIVSARGVRPPFLLAVGSIQPRKNLTRLVEAYAQLRRKHSGVQLVIVGPGGFRQSSVRDAIVEHNLGESVRWLGYVPESELVALYNAAIALVYPSVYEGFGLPVVEAMACECPVIAANTSCMPEVAAEAALLIDPFEVSSLSDAMERIVADKDLRSTMRASGLANVTRFSWKKSAEAAVAAYRTA